MSSKPAAAKPAAKAAAGAEAPKKKGLNLVMILVPIALIAALVLVFTLPPTHAMLVNGPLKGVLAKLGVKAPAGGLGAKGKAPSDPAADAKRMSDAADAAKRDAAGKDAKIGELQAQVTALQASPSPAAANPSPTPLAVTDDMKRAANYWAGMDADKAAAVVKLLPEPYVRAVFSQMSPDAVSDIISALPAKTAARLSAGDAATSR
jgi:hypothetical protein